MCCFTSNFPRCLTHHCCYSLTQPPLSRRADSRDRPGSVRSSIHADKDPKKKDKPSAKKKVYELKKNKNKKLHAYPSRLKTIHSGTVGVALCRPNCHVYPYKIEACFRTFPKFKLIMPHTFT